MKLRLPDLSRLLTFERRFTHVIPLGVSCRVTHQVRLCFGSATAWPFDWWITPLDGFARYLADPTPERIYGEGCLEERVEEGRVVAIRSRQFGMELFHEFPRTRVETAERVVSVVAPGWRQHVEAAEEKHRTRLERLLALNERANRLLFVRHKVAADPWVSTPSAKIEALWDLLCSRWRRAKVDLLLVNVPLAGRLPRGVRSVVIDDRPGPPGEEWQGDHAVWRAAFAQQRLVLAPDSPSRSASGSVRGMPD